MQSNSVPPPLRVSLVSLCIGAIGAGLAWLLSMPAPIIVGPALLVSIVGIAGVRVHVDDRIRNVCFVLLGVGIGAGFDPNASAAILHWPLAFVTLAVGLYATMLISRFTLTRVFGFDHRSAVLAAAPGHLSFVMSLAETTGTDIGKIALAQSTRLLALTLIVPFVAQAIGYPLRNIGAMGGPPMMLWELALLAAGGVAVGLVFQKLKVPAPLLMGCMAVSGLTHVTAQIDGGVPSWILTPAFMTLGTVIGTRFSGMTRADARGALLAGVTITLIAAIVAVLTAAPVAYMLGMPVAHVLVAFAPGGLETMIALGAVLKADPGFVAACHIMRLVILIGLIPLMLGRQS
ncbi:AbrB family transcriptional regulator [Phaeobacter sp. 22II1-1F12B]|uniref:AbrB family transcriptional regulator n=1 Tax=Phaeobacter sp. 22II1-1F12B TaxID=1317111 RepID=UPI000B525E68|nr:AbrB family transcriptional regulator [Phaeobacter sp. 22II1-1F12B]